MYPPGEGGRPVPGKEDTCTCRRKEEVPRPGKKEEAPAPARRRRIPVPAGGGRKHPYLEGGSTCAGKEEEVPGKEVTCTGRRKEESPVPGKEEKYLGKEEEPVPGREATRTWLREGGSTCTRKRGGSTETAKEEKNRSVQKQEEEYKTEDGEGEDGPHIDLLYCTVGLHCMVYSIDCTVATNSNIK